MPPAAAPAPAGAPAYEFKSLYGSLGYPSPDYFGSTGTELQDLVLFRGLGLGWHGDKPFAAGEEFVDKGYVSTSVSYKVAEHFAVGMADGEEKPSRRAVFVLYLARPGEKGLLIDKENEDEVILPHGRRFRVMAAKNAAAAYDLYLVQLCAAACDAAVPPDVNDFWSGFSAPN